MEGRLPIALGSSLLINAIVWAAVGSAFAIHAAGAPPPIEIQRIVLHKDGKKVAKIIKPEEVKKKVARIVKEHHLTPPPKPKEFQKPVTQSRPTAPQPHHAPPPPQGAHHRIIASKPSSNAPAKSFTAPPDGKATLGKPTEAQAPGNVSVNPPDPPKTAPPPVVPTPPEKGPVSPPADPGPKTPLVKAPDPVPESKPEVKPKKKGPSRDAQHSNEVEPSIPDELKSQDFKKFVRVRVDIPADGSFTVTLRTSSGNDEVDKRILDALKKWTWKPKLVEGEPVDSTQLFRFEFEIK